MRLFRVSGITYYTMRTIADSWGSYLHNVGCSIKIIARNNTMLFVWSNDSPSTIHHLLDVVDDSFGEVEGIGELVKAIKDIKDGGTVTLYWGSGKVETE